MLSKRLFLAAMIWLPLRSAAQTQTANATKPCEVPPFTLEINNQRMDDGLFSWGVSFLVGNPAQKVILIPSTVTNSTLLNQDLEGGLCKLSDTQINNQCKSIRGGFFNQNKSSTWQPTDLKTSDISREEPTWEYFNKPKDVPDTLGIGPITEIGYDDIRIKGNTDFILRGAGLALNQRGNQSNVGMIGLGLDSVFLDDLVAQNRSPSRSWGLYSGSRSVVNERPGELVIGGWNDEHVEWGAEWHEFDINMTKIENNSRSCPLQVGMTDLTLISEDGEHLTELMGSSYTSTVCIEPYDNHFRWTKEMIENWKRETGFDETLMDPYSTSDKGLAFIEPGLPYEQNKTKMWQLRITLQGGYVTTITYDEMQRPLEGWDKTGQLQTVDGISNAAILNKATEGGESPTLGRIFLSRTYLRVDYERMKFYLAAIDTDPDSADGDLKPMKPPICDTSQNDSGGIPVGPIVGGVVGGVAVVILFVAFLIWFGKRRRNKEKKKQEMAFRGPSHRGSFDPEPANGMRASFGFVGPPSNANRNLSTATTASNGRPLIDGVSPRGSTQAVEDGSAWRRDTAVSDHGPPMSPVDLTTPVELEATKGALQ